MNKCNTCIFLEKNGFRDMGFSCDTCKLLYRLEEIKRTKGLEYNSFNSLLDKKKDDCIYYTNNELLIDTIIEKGVKKKNENTIKSK